MKMYYHFYTEDFNDEPIVIETLGVIVEDSKTARRFLRHECGKNITEENILKCCNGEAAGFGRHKFEDGRTEKYVFRFATEEETKTFNERKKQYLENKQNKKNEEDKVKETQFYVYKFFYKNSGIIFYIGKGKKNRDTDTSKYQRNKFFNSVKNIQGDNIGSEKIYKGLTEEEALDLEHKTICDLLNNGYKLISDTGYFKHNIIIDYDTSNEKLLMNILDGGKDEQQNKKVSQQSRNKMSEAQKKYANSEEGKAKNSQAQLIAQNNPKTKQKRQNSLKKYYSDSEARTKASNAAKKWMSDPSRHNSKNNNSKPIHCIELNKTFIFPSDVIEYFYDNFDTYIDGNGMPAMIKARGIDGVHTAGTILGNGEKYYKQLHWRFATPQEIEFENVKRIRKYMLKEKIRTLELEREERIQRKILMDIVEKESLKNYLYKGYDKIGNYTGKYNLPKTCEEIFKDLEEKIGKDKLNNYIDEYSLQKDYGRILKKLEINKETEKVEPTILRREEIKNNKPSSKEQDKKNQNSYTQKFKKNKTLKCTSVNGKETIFGTLSDAIEYLQHLGNTTVNDPTTLGRKARANEECGCDKFGALTWSVVEKDSDEYKNLIKQYDDRYQKIIDDILKDIEEQENNDLISDLNRIKELQNEKENIKNDIY